MKPPTVASLSPGSCARKPRKPAKCPKPQRITGGLEPNFGIFNKTLGSMDLHSAYGGSWKLETKAALCLAGGSWKLETKAAL